jgi:ankyrin repeat protein
VCCLGCVVIFFFKGANLTLQTRSGMTPLDEALVRGRLNVVKLLDEHGVNVVDSFDKEGQAPIHVASREGFFNIVKYLVEDKKCTVWLNNKKHVRALNIARQGLKDHPADEAKFKEIVHYLFDLEASGMGGDPPASSYLPEAAPWINEAKKQGVV